MIDLEREMRPSTNGHGHYIEHVRAGNGFHVPHQPHAPHLSVIVPTRNESGNIELLLQRIHGANIDVDYEVIFVDDSVDETPDVIDAARKQFDFDIRLIKRPLESHNGLGGAVVDGMIAARGQWLCVMDADLQHPPEVIPQLLQQADASHVQLVLASRLTEGASREGLNFFRTLVSRSLALLSKAVFPKRLRTVTDPLTGFFVVQRDAIDPAQLKPDGFKILLEILVRNPELTVAEVPFEFGRRYANESKASSREVLRLFRHMGTLRLERHGQLARFLAVGASGIVVNNVIMALFTELLGIHYLVSAVMATQGSTFWNFSLANSWVFPGDTGNSYWRRLISFMTMSNVLLLIRGPVLVFLVSGLGLHYLLANFLTLVGMTAIRFAISDKLIWKTSGSKASTSPVWTYNIHDIITVRSMQKLPELAYFMTTEPLSRVDLDVKIVPNPAEFKREESICYDELLGRFGFSIVVNRGDDMTEVVASPMVSKSPHVLYTNVVEALLRWMFVRKGYALMHGACLDFDGRAVFITAQTDTGKTTTILKTIQENGRSIGFLSDDMTIFSRDGQVMNYPKPLTISQHTVHAIGGAPLSRRERRFLALQSRLHSRGGRRFGMLLSSNRMPAATLNALVQRIVPPPKFMVDKLIPKARYTRVSQLAHIALIERGEAIEFPLPKDRKLGVLLANADDAYGFPPYPALASSLSTWKGIDLGTLEAALVGQVIADISGTVMRSDHYDWYRHIPLLVAHQATASEAMVRTVADDLAPDWLVPATGGLGLVGG